MFHLSLHFFVPAIVAAFFFRKQWRLALCLMILTMFVDMDHLLASPIYDPSRCSIGFHPLHKFWIIGLYGVLCFIPKTKILGIGLIIHMALDSIDCQMTNGVWFS